MLDEPKPLRAALITALVVVLLLGGAAVYFGGRPALEKTMTSLAMPAGLVWLTLLMTFAATLNRRHFAAATLVAAGLALLSAAGNESLARRLVGNLEAPYVSAEPPPQVETAVLLGGGVWETPASAPQGGTSADRVLSAAAHYHAGRVSRFVCTGTLSPDVSRLSRTEAEIGRDLLLGLGVPESAVSTGVGANTREEIEAIAEDVEEGRLPSPVGIITSAWHMGRVARLAEAAGLEVTPLPCDFRSGGQPPAAAEVISIVPTGGALALTALSLRELAAGQVGR